AGGRRKAGRACGRGGRDLDGVCGQVDAQAAHRAAWPALLGAAGLLVPGQVERHEDRLRTVPHDRAAPPCRSPASATGMPGFPGERLPMALVRTAHRSAVYRNSDGCRCKRHLNLHKIYVKKIMSGIASGFNTEFDLNI